MINRSTHPWISLKKIPHVRGLNCTVLGAHMDLPKETDQWIQKIHDGLNHWLVVAKRQRIKKTLKYMILLGERKTTMSLVVFRLY
jgi:hypothetical protein